MVKEVTNTGSPDPNKHFNKIRTRNAKERHARFPGNSFCKERLTGTRGPIQEDTLGNLGPELVIFLRGLEKFHHFPQFLFGFVSTGHIPEEDAALAVAIELCLALAKAHDPAAAALGIVHHEEPQDDNDDHGQDTGKDAAPERRLGRQFGLDFHIAAAQRVNHLVIAGCNGRKFGAILESPLDNGIIDDGDALYIILLDFLHKIAVAHIVLRSIGCIVVIIDPKAEDKDEQVEKNVSKESCHGILLSQKIWDLLGSIYFS